MDTTCTLPCKKLAIAFRAQRMITFDVYQDSYIYNRIDNNADIASVLLIIFLYHFKTNISNKKLCKRITGYLKMDKYMGCLTFLGISRIFVQN